MTVRRLLWQPVKDVALAVATMTLVVMASELFV